MAPAYAPAVELRGYLAVRVHPDPVLVAARKKLGVRVEALASDCIQCEDISGYDVRCRGAGCVAVDLVSRSPTRLTLGFTAVRRGERLDHQAKLDLVVEAASPAALEAAITAIALETGVRGAHIPLRAALAPLRPSPRTRGPLNSRPRPA